MAMRPDKTLSAGAQAERLYDQAWRLHRGMQLLLTVYPDLADDALYRVLAAEAYENYERAFLTWIERDA